MRYLIKNGSIVDPARRVVTVGDLLIEDGKVMELIDLAEMAPDREGIVGEVEIINARGCVVAPGFTDLHVRLREPGDEQSETIATGTLAAAQGGFTTICVMPDTIPATDRASMVRQVRQIARRDAHVHIEMIGAVTLDRAGKTLAEMAELVEAGCIAFSDGDHSLSDPALMRSALAYANMLGVPVMSHCEEQRLNLNWAMHEGVVSTRLGLPGYPAAAEEAQIARDIALAELTGAHLHICHVSTAQGVAMIRAAKQRGLRVTADVTPHHLTLTDRWVLGSLAAHDLPLPGKPPAPHDPPKRGRKKGTEAFAIPSWLDPKLLAPYDPATRVNPPLRSNEDVEALVEGVRDNTIDAIATDHTPCSLVEKDVEYGLAMPGISGLETALGLILTLVHRGELDLVGAIAKLTEGPAQVLGRSPATLRVGARADIVIFNPDRSWNIDTSQFVSLGRNSPLQGQRLKGQVMLSMSAGVVVFRRGNFGKTTDTVPQASRLDGIIEE